MMNMKNIAFAGALALGAASSAQAVTFTPNVNDSFTLTLDWVAKANPADGFEGEAHTFGVAFDFDLAIVGVENGSAAVGYFIEDSAGTRLIDTTFGFTNSTCSGNAGNDNTQCNLLFDFESTPKDIFSGLNAGEYTFGVFGGGQNEAGSITFEFDKVAAVPLPAAGLMLLGALGAVGATRRRKA